MEERPVRGHACAGRRSHESSKASTCVARSSPPRLSVTPPRAAQRDVAGCCAGGRARRRSPCVVVTPPPSRMRPLYPGAAAVQHDSHDDDEDSWESAEGEPEEYTTRGSSARRALDRLWARDNHDPAEWLADKAPVTTRRHSEAANDLGERYDTFDTIALYAKMRESLRDSTMLKKRSTKDTKKSNDMRRKNLEISGVQTVESDDTMYSAREGSLDTMYSAHSFVESDNRTAEDTGWQGFERTASQRDGSLVTMYSALSDTEESVRDEPSQAEKVQRPSSKRDRERLSLTENKKKVSVVERGPRDLPERDGALRPAKPSRRLSTAVKTASRGPSRGSHRHARLTGPSDLTGSFRFVELAGSHAGGSRDSHRRRSVFSTQPAEHHRSPSSRFRFERPTRDGDPEVARLRFDLTVSKVPGCGVRCDRVDASQSADVGSRRGSRGARRRRLEECVRTVVKELAVEMAQQQDTADAIIDAQAGRPSRATAYPVAGAVAVPIWSLQAPPRGCRPAGSGGGGGGGGWGGAGGGGGGGGGGGCWAARCGCDCGSRPCSAAPSLGSTGPDYSPGCGEDVRAWRRVWSSVNLAEDAAAPDARRPPCACACTCAADRRSPPRELPHRYSCPRWSTYHEADRETSLRRNLWSAEDARTLSPASLRRRYAGCAGCRRRSSGRLDDARNACCSCYGAARRDDRRRDADRSFGTWDEEREPSGWEMGCRCCAECDRLERHLQQWNRERASRPPWDEDGSRSSRWEPVPNRSSRWGTQDRFEMENRRRRPWGDEDRWNRSRMFQCTCASDGWDGPVRETTSSEGTDGASSLDAEQDPFLRRRTTLNYRVDQEIPRNRTGIGPYYESPTRQRACENAAEVVRLSAANNSLPVSPVVSEPSRINDVVGKDVLDSKTFCNPEIPAQGTAQDNYFLLAPPAHFSAGSNDVANSKREINPTRISTSAETNGQAQKNGNVLGAGEFRSRVLEVPEKGIRVSQTASQFLYQSIVSRAHETIHTISNGTDGQNLVMHVAEKYSKDITNSCPGDRYSGANMVSELTNIHVSRGTTSDFPGIKNSERSAQNNGEGRVVTGSAQVGEGQPLLETITNSSVIRTSGNVNERTPCSAPNYCADNSIATGRSANLADPIRHSSEARESIRPGEPISDDGNILQARELFNTCSISNSSGMQENTFEAAWNVIEKSSIFKNAVDNHNREINAIESEKTNSSKDSLRFISTSQVPEIVNAAWNVIKTSGMFKDKLEKLEKSSDLPSPSRNISQLEAHPPVLSGSEIFHSASSVVETSDTSNQNQEQEATEDYMSNSFKDNTQHAITNAESEIVNAAWNVIETSTAFKEELERLTTPSSAVENRRIETTPKTHSTDILGIFEKSSKRCESPSQKRQKRSKRNGDSQVPSISGERAVLSMTDFNDGKEIVQKAWDVIKKSDEFSCLSRRHRSISSERERLIMGGGGGGGDGRSEIRSVATSPRSTGDSKERAHESRFEMERMNADRNVITKHITDTCDKCGAAFGELSPHDNELIRTIQTSILGTDVPASCAGILSSPRHNYVDDIYRKSHDKKVHFKTPERQDSLINARKTSANSPSTSRECTDDNLPVGRESTSTTNNSRSTMNSSSLCSSTLQMSPVDMYAFEAADVFNTIARNVGNLSSTLKDHINRFTTSKEIGHRDLQSAGTNTLYSEAESTLRNTIGVPSDKNKQSLLEQAQSNEVFSTSWHNAGVQTNVRKEESVRKPKEHSDKCVQAECIHPSERIVCSTHTNDPLCWNRTFSRWRPAKSVQADTLGNYERRDANNEIRHSKYVQVNATKSSK